MPSTARRSPSTRTRCPVEEALKNETGGPFRIRVTALDGRDLVLDGSVSPVVDGAVIVFRDVTDEHLRHELLVQSGKLAAIGELAAGVAHEINNPLFAILGLTEFLLKEAEPGSKAQQRLELIQQTGLEIKEIVRALLDFARENAEERHEVALDDVVRSTVDLVRRTNAHKGVELLDTYEDAGALVYASPNQLKQVFLNLIANARQAMPNGGTVTVDVRTEGGFAVATVCDDGPGIEADVLSRIFEPFFTTKRNTGGTGLGLSVSIGIAEAHGGALTALLRGRKRRAVHAPSAPLRRGAGALSRILVIDDEDVIRALVRRSDRRPRDHRSGERRESAGAARGPRVRSRRQ